MDETTILSLKEKKVEKDTDYILAAVAVSQLFKITHDINEAMKILYVCHATDYRALIKSVIEKAYAKDPVNVYCLDNLIKIQSANLNQFAQVINKKCADYSFSDKVKEDGEKQIVELTRTTEEDWKSYEEMIDAI